MTRVWIKLAKNENEGLWGKFDRVSPVLWMFFAISVWVIKIITGNN